MDFMGSTHTGKGKKPTTLVISVKCESRRRAKNIQMCLIEFLTEDLSFQRKEIKTELKDVV